MQFNTKQVAGILGVPYHTIDNLVRSGIIEPFSPGQGASREFDFNNLVLSALAVLLRQDGYKTQDIKRALETVKDNWQDGADPGSLEVDKHANFEFANVRIMHEINKKSKPIIHLPNMHYDIKAIADILEKASPNSADHKSRLFSKTDLDGQTIWLERSQTY